MSKSKQNLTMAAEYSVGVVMPDPFVDFNFARNANGDLDITKKTPEEIAARLANLAAMPKQQILGVEIRKS